MEITSHVDGDGYSGKVCKLHAELLTICLCLIFCIR